MALFKNLTEATKDVDNAVKTGVKRALNRTLSSTKTYISKQIRSEIGLKSKDVNARLKLNKPQTGFKKKHSFSANVSIAMMAYLPMRVFSPRAKKLKTKKGPRVGVTVKIGKLGRFLVPNAFLMMKGIAIVAMRIGKKRYPTKQVFTEVWQETVTTQYGSYRRYAQETFNKIVGHQIQYALDTRTSKNKSEN